MIGSGTRPWFVSVAALCSAAALQMLAGCASQSALPPEVARAPATPPVAIPAPPAAAGLASFELTMQQRAQEAERQGRLADAAWAWEALSLARPERRDAQAELLRLSALLQSRVTLALAQAQNDRQRGELERAMRGYLTVLSLQSEHRGAAEALRAIERERNERQFLGRFSRQTITRSTRDAAQNQTAPDKTLATESRNLSEHATLLAEQGEFDSAMALLAPVALAAGGDPELRRLHAQLHCQRARSLPAQPSAPAVAALRECLQLDPGNEAAALRLRALGSPAK